MPKMDKWKEMWYRQALPELCRELEEQDAPSKVAVIFRALGEPVSPACKELAAGILAEYLARLEWERWFCLLEHFSDCTGMQWDADRSRVTVDGLLTPRMGAAERMAVLTLASVHPNGFLREQAVRALAVLPPSDQEPPRQKVSSPKREGDGFQTFSPLGLLYLRTQDWVLAVRAAALEAFTGRLPSATDEELVELLFLVWTLRRRTPREALTAAREAFLAELRTEERFPVLLGGLCHPCRGVREMSIRLLTGEGGGTGLTVGSPAFEALCTHRDPEPYLRRLIFVRLCEAEGDAWASLLPVCRRMLTDKNPANRVAALNRLSGYAPGEAYMAAEPFLTDASEVARRCGRTVRERCAPADGTPSPGRADFAGNYRRLLTGTPIETVTPGMILGLSEVGEAADGIHILPFVAKECRPKQTKAALTALMRLDVETYVPLVTACLNDPRPGVVRTASELLAGYPGTDYAQVLEIFRAACTDTDGRHARELTQIRRRCLSLLSHAGKWSALEYILSALTVGEPAVTCQALTLLDHWIRRMNSSFAVPGRGQAERIGGLIDRHAAIMGEGRAALLRFALK